MTLLMLKLFSTVGGELQPALNVFGYKSNLVIANELPQFVDAFLAQVLPSIQNVVHVQTKFTRVEAQDLGNPLSEEIRVLVPPASGAAGGDPLPPWLTWNFQYRRANRTQRSGRKGFGQLDEGMQSDGVPTGPVIASLNALAVVLFAPLKIALIDTWFPVILSKVTQFPPTWTDHPVQAVIFKGIGTQNTRKRR